MKAALRMTRRPVASLVIVVVLLCFFVGWPYLMIRHAVRRSDLARLAIGMTKDEVRAVLGSPNDVKDGGAEWMTWEYARWGNAGYVALHFDATGRLAQINDESVFP